MLVILFYQLDDLQAHQKTTSKLGGELVSTTVLIVILVENLAREILANL